MAGRKSKSRTALRGSVNNIILESLYDGEKYGYEIIKEVEEKTNGKVKLKQPSLYSSLSRFEQKGLIDSYWQDSDIGGKRHYYKLTEAGVLHYRKNVLKEDIEEVQDTTVEENIDQPIHDEEEYLEDKLSSYEIDDHEEVQDISKYEYNVEAKINDLLNGTSNTVDEDDLEDMYEELEEERIYTEEDLEEDTVVSDEYVADHEFRTPTPITEVIDDEEVNKYDLSKVDTTENALDDIMDEDSDDIMDDIDLYDTTEISEPVEVESPVVENKKPRIITDENGITKMYYDDIEQPRKTEKVFDNVVYRTNNNDNIFRSRAAAPARNKEVELTEEEKELKSKSFMERFDQKSEQLKREKSLNSPKREESQKIDYNYKSKLNDLFNSASDDETFVSQEVEIDNYTPRYDLEESDEGTFDNTTDIDNYMSDLNNNGYSVKVYSEEKVKEPTIKYLQINRAKFSFGLTMLAFMLIQTTLMLVLFKNKGILMDNQFWVFQAAYISVAFVSIMYCIPVFISPNKQASNSFKLSYSLMFGLLAFFIIVILTYAVNTFMGMELTNIKYYLTTLIVPIVMSLNFVFGPLIYWLITQNKKYYN